MFLPLNAALSAWVIFDSKKHAVQIEKILYEGAEYPITKMAHHYHDRLGRTLRHIYCVTSDSKYFKLVLNTETLQWTVEEIHDDNEI